MRHGLDFVDLQNPQVRRPPVRLEQRIVIGTEMSGDALPMNGDVKHPADVGARDGAAMHADADEATRELVHGPRAPSSCGARSTRIERGPRSRGCLWYDR